MKKTAFLTFILILLSLAAFSQTMICYKVEIVKYDNSTGSFLPEKKIDYNSEAYFDERFIRINDAELYLTKKRIKSKQSSREGTVTIFEVVNEKNNSFIVTQVEDIKGIVSIFLTEDERSDTGIVFRVKNR